jgi:serine/threonine protein kinase
MEGMPVSGVRLPETGDEIAGKYRIDSVLGQGGMGTVFAAENLLTGKRVAIKWLLPEHAQGPSRERLLREARIACSVEHPNIVDIYDVGEHQGGLFLVMEYLRGRPLSDRLAERGRFDPAELIGMLIPAMRGVHAAHQAGVIHRDLKPENIILSEVDGQIIPKVVDFGVSKTLGTSNVPHSSLTRTGALVGTPHYMALEQVDGSNLVDPRTDVYAFGVIMYRGLTGHFPFDGSSLGEVILKIGTKDPAPMRLVRPDLPAELEAVVLRSMSRNRDVRFANLEEFARALEPFAPWVRFRELPDASGRVMTTPISSGSQGLLTPPHLMALPPQPISAQGTVPRDTPAHAFERVRRRRAFLIGAAVALVVVLAALGWLVQKSETSARPAPQVPMVPSAPAVEKSLADTQKPAAVEPVKEPALAAEPALAPPPGAAPADAPAADAVAEPVEPAVEAEPVQKKADKRRSQGRAGRATRAESSPRLIPGDRTKGLSTDDF